MRLSNNICYTLLYIAVAMWFLYSGASEIQSQMAGPLEPGELIKIEGTLSEVSSCSNRSRDIYELKILNPSGTKIFRQRGCRHEWHDVLSKRKGHYVAITFAPPKPWLRQEALLYSLTVGEKFLQTYDEKRGYLLSVRPVQIALALLQCVLAAFIVWLRWRQLSKNKPK